MITLTIQPKGIEGSNQIDPQALEDMKTSALELQFATLWAEMYPAIDLYTQWPLNWCVANPALSKKGKIVRGRKAFDFAQPMAKVAIEIHGGAYIQGRHSRAQGMKADAEKVALANENGWTVFSLIGEEQINEEKLAMIARTIKSRMPESEV